MAAFIKFVEMAGGIPVYMHSDMSESELTFMLDRINGVLLPGGTIPLVDN